MSTIDPSSQIAVFLRSKVAGLRKVEPHDQPKQNANPLTPQPPQNAATSTTTTTSAQVAMLPLLADAGQRLLHQIRGLRADDVQRSRKAFRLFLESVLLQEFAPSLTHSVDLDPLVTQVLSQMESDDDLRAAMENAANQLIQAATAAA
jgi:hypothetical protein